MNPGAHLVPDVRWDVACGARWEAILCHEAVVGDAAEWVHFQWLIQGPGRAGVNAGRAFGRALFSYRGLIVVKFGVDDKGGHKDKRAYLVSEDECILSVSDNTGSCCRQAFGNNQSLGDFAPILLKELPHQLTSGSVDTTAGCEVTPCLVVPTYLTHEFLGKGLLGAVIDCNYDGLGRWHDAFGVSALDWLENSFDEPGVHFIPGLELIDIAGKAVGGGNADFAVAQVEAEIFYVLA